MSAQNTTDDVSNNKIAPKKTANSAESSNQNESQNNNNNNSHEQDTKTPESNTSTNTSNTGSTSSLASLSNEQPASSTSTGSTSLSLKNVSKDTDEKSLETENETKNNNNKNEKHEKNENKDNTDKKEKEFDFESHRIDIPHSLHKLKWEDIAFKDENEKAGAMKLQEILHKDCDIPLSKLPPFEITRYYLGSFSDIKLATRKWLDSIDMYSEYKFDSISKENLRIYFEKISNVMKIGGTTNKNELVCSLGCKDFIAKNFELNNTFIYAYFLLLHLLTSNLNILRNGLILIGSCDDYSSKNFTYQLVPRFALFQKVYPIRLARIYVINGSRFVETCFNLIKPLLSKFMQQRIFWMQKDVFLNDKLIDHNLIPNNILNGNFDSKKINPMVEYCMKFLENDNNLDHFKLDKKKHKIKKPPK